MFGWKFAILVAVSFPEGSVLSSILVVFCRVCSGCEGWSASFTGAGWYGGPYPCHCPCLMLYVFAFDIV